MTYYFETQADLNFAAEEIAKEQSAGHSRTWTGISNKSRQCGSAKVLSVNEVEPFEKPLPVGENATPGRFSKSRRAARVVIEYDNWESSDGLVSLLNVAAGEPQHLAVLDALKLEDISTRDLVGTEFPGPLYGTDYFTRGLPGNTRFIICAPIKPSAGLLPEEAANLAYAAAIGGATIIKDDELAFSTRRSDGITRAQAVSTAVRNAEQKSGEKKIYVANAIGSTSNLIHRARALKEAGADALLVAPALQGQDVATTLLLAEVACPIIAHNAFQTNSTRVKSFGVALDLWVILQRLAGADGVVLPSPFGSFGSEPSEIASCIQSCTKEVNRKLNTLPLHSGAVSVSNVRRLLDLHQTAVTAATSGTGIFDHPDGAKAGAGALRIVADRIAIDSDFDVSDESDSRVVKAIQAANRRSTSKGEDS